METAITTAFGEMTVIPGGPEGVHDVLSVMRDASTWLASRGIKQWTYVFTENGEQIIRQRLIEGEVFLLMHAGEAVGVLRLLWMDTDYWGEYGMDGQAGYLHMFTVMRRVSGAGVGAAWLEWAARETAARGRRCIRLETDANNPGICGYYERLGFRDRGIKVIPGVDLRLYEREACQILVDTDE